MNSFVTVILASLSASPDSAAGDPLTEPLTLTQDEAAAEPTDPKWTGSFNLGATSTDGNTDIKNATLSFDAELRREKDRWTASALWFYSEENDSVTQRTTQGGIKYDYFVDEKLYYLANAAAATDREADLQLRATTGVGVGYQWRDDESWKFSTEAGPSWFYEDYERQSPDDYISLRLQYNVEYLKLEEWTISQLGLIFPSLEDSDDIYTRLDTRVRYDLKENMFAQVQWLWEWDNTPASGNDRSDHRYLLTIGWSF